MTSHIYTDTCSYLKNSLRSFLRTLSFTHYYLVLSQGPRTHLSGRTDAAAGWKP